MEWMKSFRTAIEFMENNLLESITAEQVCEVVHISPFYFQRSFKIVTGYSLSEYIRYRRLYQSALEIIARDKKIIDLAYTYGYETPESFTKAFTRFHGISPSQVKLNSNRIKPFLPMSIELSIKGGQNMNYTVERLRGFRVIGFKGTYSFESSYSEIPKSWAEFNEKWEKKTYSKEVLSTIQACGIGEYGVCLESDMDAGIFDYMIAGTYNGEDIPDGMTVYEIPEMEWAKFKCTGPMPGALQRVNTYIFKEWLPGNPEFEIALGINLEWYSMGDISAPDYESAIWIPVKRI
ncbi:MAG: AraC family transcriptional regulator [Clostridia bacterium]|nr:AraC family transcriptional regulator [Clostridia bacterium]